MIRYLLFITMSTLAVAGLGIGKTSGSAKDCEEIHKVVNKISNGLAFKVISKDNNNEVCEIKSKLKNNVLLSSAVNTLNFKTNKTDYAIKVLKDSLVSDCESKDCKSKLRKINEFIKEYESRKSRLSGEELNVYSKYVFNSLDKVFYKKKEDYHSGKDKLNETCEVSSTITPSIIVYKKGDYDQVCKKKVDEFSGLGFNSISVFHPVHTFENGVIVNENSPTEGETLRCLKYIESKGMKIKWHPHLEHVDTMMTEGEKFWRMKFELDTTSQKFQEALYGPLLKFLDESSYNEEVSISIGAEIDKSVFMYAQKNTELVKKLKSKYENLSISFNPNGDFHRVGRGSISCKEVLQFYSEIDYIAPSMYFEYGHIEKDKKKRPSYYETKKNYFKELRKFLKVKANCNNNFDNKIDQVIKKLSKNFSIGEFSLGKENSYYKYFLGQIEDENKTKKFKSSVTLWNDPWNSNWDPIASKGRYSGSNSRTDILSFINQCNVKEVENSSTNKNQ